MSGAMSKNDFNNARKWDKFVAVRFTYTHDKVENWRSHASELLADKDYHMRDDCDGLASTVLDCLARAGVPLDKLWRVVVKSPQAGRNDYIDHMVGMIEVDSGQRYIVGDTFSEGKPVKVERTVHTLVETSRLDEGIMWKQVPKRTTASSNPRPAKFKLGRRSKKNRDECHPALIEIINLAITLTTVDFGVVEGARTKQQQQANVAKGVSWTMNSRHLKRWCSWNGRRYRRSHAVDLLAYVGKKGAYTPPELYQDIADAMYAAAEQLGYSITWGGEWKSQDLMHFQLSWSQFPAERETL